MIPDQRFHDTVEVAPLVSVDLVVVRGEEVLLGLRRNRPARRWWFAPGGRIRKNERIADAMARIAFDELGMDLRSCALEHLGPYEHFYKDCFSGKPGVGTHYVVLAFRVAPGLDFEPRADNQHETLRWWPIVEALKDEKVHEYTKAYLRTTK